MCDVTATSLAMCRYPAGLSEHDFQGLFGYKVACLDFVAQQLHTESYSQT